MGTTVLRGMIPAGTRAGYPLAILTRARRLRYMKLWSTETRLYSKASKAWVVVVGPCDEIRIKPKDKMPRLPQSIQYPPGMEPKVTARWIFESIPTF